jgi:hypothetical protein
MVAIGATDMIWSYAAGRAFRPAKRAFALGTEPPRLFGLARLFPHLRSVARCAATATALKRVRVFDNKQFGDNVASVYS